MKLLVRLRRFRCDDCEEFWSQQVPQSLAPAGSKLTIAAINWALVAVVLDGMSISAVSRNLGAAWNTVNTAVLEAGYSHSISDPTRFDGVTTIGVDEHCWKHTRWRSDRFVTVIVDLTPRKDDRPARLLDMIPGRSKQVLKTWLEAQDTKFRLNVKTVATDGFTGYKTAVREVLPTAATVMDPFHVVGLVGDKITQCRQRLQQETTRRRGRKSDVLFQAPVVVFLRCCLQNLNRVALSHDTQFLWGHPILACAGILAFLHLLEVVPPRWPLLHVFLGVNGKTTRLHNSSIRSDLVDTSSGST